MNTPKDAAALPLDSRSWNMQTSLPLMFSSVYGEELAEMADERADIVVLTADLRTSNRTDDFMVRHPDRFIEMGIAEQNMVSFAAGLAACGFVPYVATFAAFLSLMCAEQVRTDLAYPGMRVRMLAHHAGISFGFYGTSHHATEDLAIMRAIEGMTVVCPCDAEATRAVLRETVDYDGPVYIRLGRGREKTVYAAPPSLDRGKFVKLREGTDVTVVATGVAVAEALAAAEQLDGEGISVEVLDSVFVKPFDAMGLLESVSRTGAVLTAEEHTVNGGLGGAAAEVLAEAGVAARFARVGLPPEEYSLIGPPTALWRHYGLSSAGIAAQLRRLLGISAPDSVPGTLRMA
jgi:transketolase